MAPSSELQNQNPQLLFVDTLYCSEDYWEDEQQLHQDNNVAVDIITDLQHLQEHDLFWENDELVTLFSKQDEQRLIDQTTTLFGARREAVEWILRVQREYSFSPRTSVLAVHYFDRFVSRFHFENQKPWMTQLVSVACLSLAAKLEETHVPLLVDFQVEETKYLFEAKTIKKMEILVLSTLEWKMNLVTPPLFIDHIIRRLGFKNCLRWEFINRCESTIVSVLSDARYMCYLPSVIATATMLHVIDTVEPCLLADYQYQLLDILQIEKGELDKCSEVITELTLQNDANKSNKRKLGSMPASPNGVIDLSFSSDSSNDSWVVAASVSSSPEPLAKKLKGGQNMLSPVHDMVG